MVNDDHSVRMGRSAGNFATLCVTCPSMRSFRPSRRDAGMPERTGTHGLMFSHALTGAHPRLRAWSPTTTTCVTAKQGAVNAPRADEICDNSGPHTRLRRASYFDSADPCAVMSRLSDAKAAAPRAKKLACTCVRSDASEGRPPNRRCADVGDAEPPTAQPWCSHRRKHEQQTLLTTRMKEPRRIRPLWPHRVGCKPHP